MKKRFPLWILGAIGILLVVVVPVAIFWPRQPKAGTDPWKFVPARPVHVDHKDIVKGPFATPQEVTRACLECHPKAAEEIMATSHWTWQSKPFQVPWRDQPVTIGKFNQINNFCIGTPGNQKKCMTCHIGYGWSEDQPYDFSNPLNVDCLACHADPALYAKGEYGNPAKNVDLVAAARSVGATTRNTCGKCHFDGGGGNGVKHGDLDESLILPSENLDVHMGRYDFQCTTCHWTEKHQVKGRLIADNYQVDPKEQVSCEQCHQNHQHKDERLNTHLRSVACQTCHIPAIAIEDPTKVYWDWSTAGQEGRKDDHYVYLKIKGSFIYQTNYKPQYRWFNGNLQYRYILGDKIDPNGITYINLPAGSIDDPQARIFPFKLHVAKQPYDKVYNYLLSPITAGKNGFWTLFNWDIAFKEAEKWTGLKYSGQYGFAETWMYWPTTHMVQPATNALKCADCHGPDGRMDWQALGYPGDPAEWGGRFSKR
jgi:octaheme c-type cytochrome (tetrathionate reductase family)